MATRKKRSRHHKHRNYKRDNNKVSKKLTPGKFFFWFFTYLISIFLINTLFKSASIINVRIGYSILMGFLLIIISRVVYSIKNNSSLRMRGIVVWGIIYAATYGVVYHIFTLFPEITLTQPYGEIVTNSLFALVFTVLIIALRRMKIKPSKKRGVLGRAPDQIISGVGLLGLGILFLRFSHTVFGLSEGTFWGWFIGWGLILAGFLVLVAWWRNNVSMFTTKHSVKWK